MRNAKIAAAITAAVAAVLAVLGKAFNFGVDTTTQILMRFGYDWGRQQQGHLFISAFPSA